MGWTAHLNVAPCDPRVRWPSDHANHSTSGVEGIRKCVSFVGRRVVEFWVTDLLRKPHVLNATGVDGCPVSWLNISKACVKRQTLDQRCGRSPTSPPLFIPTLSSPYCFSYFHLSKCHLGLVILMNISKPCFLLRTLCWIPVFLTALSPDIKDSFGDRAQGPFPFILSCSRTRFKTVTTYIPRGDS